MSLFGGGGLLGSLPGLGGGGGGNSGFQQSGGSGGFFNKAQENLSSSETKNSSIGASEHSIAVGSDSTVNVLDPGAIEAAFGFASRFASESLGLVERNAGAVQRSFEESLLQTTATIDAEKTGGSQRIAILAAVALIAFAVFAYKVKT